MAIDVETLHQQLGRLVDPALEVEASPDLSVPPPPLTRAPGTNVETALALSRLPIERCWTVGLLLLLFCGASLIASHFGVELPDPVRQWSAAGAIFGAAVVGVSLAANFVAFAARKLDARARRRAKSKEKADEAKHVVANLGALTRDDAELLEPFLSGNAGRFQVSFFSKNYRLLQLGFFTIVQDMGSSWICELHPALASRKVELAAQFRKELSRLYRT